MIEKTPSLYLVASNRENSGRLESDYRVRLIMRNYIDQEIRRRISLNVEMFGGINRLVFQPGLNLIGRAFLIKTVVDVIGSIQVLYCSLECRLGKYDMHSSGFLQGRWCWGSSIVVHSGGSIPHCDTRVTSGGPSKEHHLACGCCIPIECGDHIDWTRVKPCIGRITKGLHPEVSYLILTGAIGVGTT